ncbi:histidinol dehydrogenase [Alkalibacterium subtropicum]|uniref:Histidinol dehydrogenase n=1 Tax=Alkalibacterium subtropicum TaxID=753702 RepID=A0A1I1HDL0_9LACT|nr:histidinol dehydrogenase [Alkalibacterium subtropicum]SFC21795.1 histidinol dehydrogenase [Alkalibacterium subtropicum]
MYTFDSFKEVIASSNKTDWDKLKQVMTIIQTVQESKDQALYDYSETFDNVKLDTLEVMQTDLESAYHDIEDDLRAALELAYKNIWDYQQSIKISDGEASELYQKVHPLNRVGVYVPGGTAPLVSTVLMTAVLAKVAGVSEIVVTTPPQQNGVNQAILAACHIAKVDRVFQVGGAQAIAALAYGTETVPAVDKIAGPGNQYVALAKKMVYGDVGIDSIAGPSEIVIVADDTTRADFVAYDLLAQAEHDVLARTFLISESKEKIEEIQRKVNELAGEQPRAAIIKTSLRDHHYSVHTVDKAETIDCVNFIAGEHVSIQTKDASSYIDQINTAGALFIGDCSPEAIGDYIAGPSHVLPTGGTARFSSGLTVNDFLRTNSIIALKKESFKNMAPGGMRLALEESLQAHHDSLACRMEENK